LRTALLIISTLLVADGLMEWPATDVT
jgi:hypothetical protein